MDTAKAVGIIIGNPEFADVQQSGRRSSHEKQVRADHCRSHNAGTAAEVTINYVITDVEKKRKFVCVDTHDIPIVAVIDPDMMSSMPKGLTAATAWTRLPMQSKALSQRRRGYDGYVPFKSN